MPSKGNMDIEQMRKVLEERAVVMGRLEFYSSLHKVLCKHVEKLQFRMNTLMNVTLENSTSSEYIHALVRASQNSAQQDACFEILDILLLKTNESAKAFEDWSKTHSYTDDVS